MKANRILVIAAVIIGLFLFAAIMGCPGGGQRGITAMMSRVPADTTNVDFLDISLVRGDEDLADVYESWQYGFGQEFGEFGIDFDDINQLAYGTLSMFDIYFIITGDFVSSEISSQLDTLGFTKSEYQDVGIWEGENETVALMEGLFILGTGPAVRNCIEVIESGEGSLWMNPDIQQVINRSPDGIEMQCTTQPERIPYEGVAVQCVSYIKKDDETASVIAVLLFEDEDTARDTATVIEEVIEEGEFESSEIKQDGKLVIATLTVDIEELFG